MRSDLRARARGAVRSSRARGLRAGLRIALALGLLPALLAAAPGPIPTVQVQQGNVVLVYPGGERRAVTNSGLDREAVLSPLGNAVAFVRQTPGRIASSGAGDVVQDEIWLFDLGSGQARRLLAGRASNEMSAILAAIRSLQFSRDGSRLFFLSAAWGVSDAVHRVDVRTGEERFLTRGNALKVITAGPQADHLLVNQHRTRGGSSPGSSDRDFIFTLDGEEVRDESRLGPPALAKHRGAWFTLALPSGDGWVLSEWPTYGASAADEVGYSRFVEARHETLGVLNVQLGDLRGFGVQAHSAWEFLAQYAPLLASAQRQLKAGKDPGGRVAWALWSGPGAADGDAARVALIAYWKSPREILVASWITSANRYEKLGGMKLLRKVAKSIERPFRVPAR